jgi:8-oxo-dGTP pyrophosphatase MutT (NUDIX family)
MGSRINQDAWQFPQGGINPEETPEDALYRELNEEVGLEREDVEILACTRAGCAIVCRNVWCVPTANRCASARNRNGFSCA